MGKSEAKQMTKQMTEPTNGGEQAISTGNPYNATVTIRGVCDLLWHRWNCESVEAKSKAAKNSSAKKTDDIESYVYRNEKNEIAMPGEYIRQSIILAAKFKQDPRSPRKSAMDLYEAGVICNTLLASLGVTKWDYEDRRRAVVQRNGINRVRPAMRVGWSVSFDFTIVLPEYIPPSELNDTIQMAGRLIGVGDFRPTFGRFQIDAFSV